MHSKIRTAPGEKKPSYKPNYRFNELAKLKRKANLGNGSTNNERAKVNWIERGPANVGGRTRAIVVDPDDETFKTWFAGSVGGGVWKSTDAGESWNPLTEDLPNLAVTCLEMAQSNRNILYAGSGEGFFNANAITGNGIMKTTDKGATWNQLASTASDSNFSYVNRLAVDPFNENIVVAATNRGIFKTIDGGTSWTEVFSGDVIQDLRANPENFNTLFASTSEGIIRSHNAGDTWNLPFKAKFGDGVRIEFAPSRTDTNRLYASVDSNPNSLFATLDGGTTWNEVVERVLGEIPSWLESQGWYDNTIAVHPYDKNIVFVGGIDLWKAEITIDSVINITNIIDKDLDTLFTYASKFELREKNGGIGTGEEFWFNNDLVTTFIDIEIRFGSNLSQKAHRFSETNYTYLDYASVPFEVWDITNNKQLMCSFTTSGNNSSFLLKESIGSVIFVNNVVYDSSTPSSNMAKNKGLQYENLFVIAFQMLEGKTWDADNLPNINLKIEVGKTPKLFRSLEAITDGYEQHPTDTYIHVDQHNITLFPTDESKKEFIFLNGNDGGVAVSYDAGESFTEVGNNGYNTSQFYGVDKKPRASQYYGGMQDNGTWESAKGVTADKTTDYIFRIGGDGFDVSWHYKDPLKMIGGSQFNSFYKTVDGGLSYYSADAGFDGWGNSATSPFFSKIAKSYSDPDLLYTVTTEGVYRSGNFGDSWSLYPIAEFENAGYFDFAQVEISIAESQVFWAGASTNGIFISKNGGTSFSKVNESSLENNATITGLNSHPIDEATAYLTFSFSSKSKILRTTNYGDSWEDITGFGNNSESSIGFPNVATYCVAVMPFNTNIIWAGTDIGLIESVDGGNSWHLANNGLPQVSIWQIRIVDDEVVVATHGRGIWSVSLPELADHKPPVNTLSPALISVSQSVSGLNINVSLRSVYDSTHIFINDKKFLSINANTVLDTMIFAPNETFGKKSIFIKSYKDSRIYRSSIYEYNAVALLETKLGYITEFNSDNSEFLLSNFNIKTEEGFSNGALNSLHPYPNEQMATAFLRVPIVVASSNATFEYRDIAIIENGDSGSIYGENQFYDYVIVEASNGKDWVPLEAGYDSRMYDIWKETYFNEGNGAPAMYKSHSINLLDKFSVGDTLLIRFRLFADDFSNGWGWAIDNLIIQGHLVGVDETTVLPKKFALSQNYPNPFNPSTVINYSLPSQSKIKLQIFNTLGQKVKTLVNETKSAGHHKFEWNAGNLSSGVYLYQIVVEPLNDSKKLITVKKMILLK